jgi:hypothetical protein
VKVLSKFIMKTAKCYVGGFDFSGDLNKMDLAVTVEVKDSTNFLSAGKEKVPGYLDYKLSYGGFVNTGNSEKNLFENVALENVPFVLVPSSGSAGDLAYFGKATYVEYRPGGQVGELFGFDLNAEGQGDLIRGTVLLNGKTAASGNTTAIDIGAVPAGKQVYAALQVLSVTGTAPNATFKVSSSTTADGTFTDRIVFPAVNVSGAWWALPVAGPVADTKWRVDYTLTSGSKFTAVVTVGIK